METKETSIDCIIPYAGSKYFLRTLESALNQSQAFNKIIVVLDGFPAPQILPLPLPLPLPLTQVGEPGSNPIEKTQILMVDNGKKMGSGYSRNIGVRHSNSSHLVFLDHDDLLPKEYLKTIMEELREKKLRCLAVPMYYIGENDKRIGKKVSNSKYFALPSGFIIERELFDLSGKFPECYLDDTLFFRAVRKLNPIELSEKTLAYYRIHTNAESHTNTKAWWAFKEMLPLYYNGTYTLKELQEIADFFAKEGKTLGNEACKNLLTHSYKADYRIYAREAYASWLNRNFLTMIKKLPFLLKHSPQLLLTIKHKLL